MKKLQIKRLGLIANLVFIGLIAVYIFVNRSDFAALLDLNFKYLVPIFLGYVALMISNGVFLKIILVPYKIAISLKESVYVTIFSSAGNYFAPAGTGFGMKGVYLNKKHNLSYAKYVSTLGGNYLVVFLVCAFTGIVTLLFLRDFADLAQYKIILGSLLFLLILSLTLMFVRFSSDALSRTYDKRYVGKILKNVGSVISGWNDISKDRALVIKLVSLAMFNLLVSVLITYSIIMSVGLSASIAGLFLLAVVGSLSLFINITPASIGIKEAVYVFTAAIIGFSFDEILLIAVVERSMFLLTLLVLWLVVPKKFDVDDTTHTEK